MKRILSRIIDWNDCLLKDVFWSVAEAILVLLITFLYLVVVILNHGLTTDGVGFIDSVRHSLRATIRPTETIIYVTGVLASTTAYFWVRIKECEGYIVRIFVMMAVTLLLFLPATQLFMAGLQDDPKNRDFASGLATVLGSIAFLIWLFSLYNQRRIFERRGAFKGDARAEKIRERIERDREGR